MSHHQRLGRVSRKGESCGRAHRGSLTAVRNGAASAEIGGNRARNQLLTLTSSPRLKPGDSNSFMLQVQCGRVGAVIPCGFLLVPASMSPQHPRALRRLGRR